MFRRMPLYQKILIQSFLTIFIILWMLPIYFLVMRSFSQGGIDNYLAVLSLPLFPRFYMNSLIIAVSVLIVQLVIVIFAGYAFSKMNFPGKNILFLITLIGLMVPPAALIVPLFQLMIKLGLLNTYFSVIGPSIALWLPFALLLTRVAIDDIPKDLFEAAEIDGCTHWNKLLHVVLPLVKPILATVGVFSFLHSWNEYLLPLIFMKDQSMYTVTLSVSFFKGEYGADLGKIFAALVLIILPVVIFYLFAQRFLQRGLVSGAVK